MYKAHLLYTYNTKDLIFTLSTLLFHDNFQEQLHTKESDTKKDEYDDIFCVILYMLY